jgi:hypothetical protein
MDADIDAAAGSLPAARAAGGPFARRTVNIRAHAGANERAARSQFSFFSPLLWPIMTAWIAKRIA